MSRVSVVTPNYNHSRYLRQCLESVQAQTFTDWTMVVGDNASTDESVSVLRSFHDHRIQVEQRPRTVNWVRNVNLLIERASGADYVAVLHADDWWEPTFLGTMVALLDSAPGSIMASCVARLVYTNAPPNYAGLPYRRSDSKVTCPSLAAARLLTQKNWLVPAAVLMRRSLFETFPRFEESLPLVNDWLMWIRAATIGDIEVCRDSLANYRRHDLNMSKEAIRANLWADDLIRMVRMLEAEWDPIEPFPGARQAVAAGAATEILADAALRGLRGETADAVRESRLARSIAPGFTQRAFATAEEHALRAAGLPGIRAMRGPAAELGRRLWRALRPAA